MICLKHIKVIAYVTIWVIRSSREKLLFLTSKLKLNACLTMFPKIPATSPVNTAFLSQIKNQPAVSQLKLRVRH